MSSLPSTTTATGDDDMQDITFAKRGCISFWMPCFRSKTTPSPSSSYESWWWERMNSPEKKEEQWWARGCKKVREWSEIVAGPKWKTFIRRFNKHGVSSFAKQGSFHYDPLSYALNFDDGLNANNDCEDWYGYAGFSARFASVPASVKSSMDLGKDGPGVHVRVT